jgi:hypothetical protein
MLAKLKTFALVGIDAVAVEVEVDVSPAEGPNDPGAHRKSGTVSAGFSVGVS